MTPRLLPLLLLFPLLLTSCGSNETAAQTAAADKAVQTIASGNAMEAYRDSAFAFRSKTPWEAFALQAGKLKPGNIKVEWQAPVEEEGKVRLLGRATQSDGSVAEITVLLSKEITDWKLAGLNVEA